MPIATLPEVYPGISGLDDLDLLRQGLIPRELVNFPQTPAKYVDAEGVPVASISETGVLLWLAPRSARPYEQWHADIPTLVAPVAVIDKQQTLLELPKEIRTIAVLASTESSRSDVHLVRMARQYAAETGSHLTVLPLGAAAAKRPEKLAHIIGILQKNGVVADYTTADLKPNEPVGPGLVVFFTGLSGSGKSTLARALAHALLEERDLEVTLLDGDAVRRHLSQGLTFSVADRNANVRRIGWVAAEIARHGGIAIACPIAPFDATRREIRQMITERGGRFLLVHVSTPLDECERRDRKGLYAKARAGSIPEFTGVSSPYEPPRDADLSLDTTVADVDALRDVVLAELKARGWLAPLSFSATNGSS